MKFAWDFCFGINYYYLKKADVAFILIGAIVLSNEKCVKILCTAITLCIWRMK